MEHAPKRNLNLEMKRKYTFFLICILICSCSLRKEYHHFNSIPSQGWSKNDTIRYDINNLNTNQAITISFNLRNKFSYQYENLILKVIHNLEDSTAVSIELMDLALANNSGIWLGDGWGSLRQTKHLYKTINYPQLTDSSYIKILPFMPDSLLYGIEDIGIHITH